jgi:hypothetical protein
MRLISHQVAVAPCPRETGVRSVAAIGAAMVLFALCAAGATAAPSPAGLATTRLCTVARGVAADLKRSATISNAQMSRTRLKALYTKIAQAEPALLAASSGAIKTDLRQVFGFVNVVIADLKKANWTFAGLAPYAADLSARAAKVKHPLDALDAYFTKTCKFKM